MNEIEKKFFKTFEIKPELCCVTYNEPCDDYCLNCKYCREEGYPEITDRILLELICIYNSFQNDEYSLFIPFDINNIKDVALQVITKSIKEKSLNKYYCNDVEKLKQQVQALFKEAK